MIFNVKRNLENGYFIMSKKIILFVVFSVFVGFYFGQISYKSALDEQHVVKAEKTVSTYVCPMHAKIVSDHEQSCPICGMDLVKSKDDSNSDNVNENEYPEVKITSTVSHNMGVRTAIVEKGQLKRSIETMGKITRVDPMARRTITPPIRGELLFIAEKYQGDMVERGELLFTMTSKKLVDMQKKYQQAFLAGDRATATAMIPELRRMGMSLEQLGDLQASKEPMSINIYAFEDGFVYTRRGKVGESVHTGFTIFNVGGNYQVIEVTAEIFERQWSWVNEGQKAVMTVRGLPGVKFEGKVVRVEPPVGYTTRSLEVALKFRTNNRQLSQSMFAHISIDGQPKENVILVPTDTVIKTGKGDRVVLVTGDNQFQPVAVIAGEESNGFTEIREGLAVGEKVVASGQFLIDSESNLQAELRRMISPLKNNEMEHHQHMPQTADHKSSGDSSVKNKDEFQKVSLVPDMDTVRESGRLEIAYWCC